MARAKQLKRKRILSLVCDFDLGLCLELGDENVDNEVYGFAPTHDFVKALEREIRFQTGNVGKLDKHPTLRRVIERALKYQIKHKEPR